MSGLYWMSGQMDLLWLPLLLAASVAGFLYWNFPPARIFMGDTGSGFLGFVFGVLSIQAAATSSLFFWSWLILLAVFIVDATMTLCCRVCRGEKPHQAHRTHAYQHAASLCGSHLPVTVSIGLINVFWLSPLAIAVGLEMIPSWVGLCCAYVPLFLIGLYYRAGLSIDR
jgi:Fuc2NAc and GlcNAc transferase